MFSLVVVFFALVSTISSEQGINGTTKSETNQLGSLANAYEKKCLKNLNATEFNKIRLSIANVSTCMTIDTNNASVPQFCNQLSTCAHQIIDVLVTCVENTEKYLTDLLINGLNGILNKFCTQGYVAQLENVAKTRCNSSQSLTEYFSSNCLPKLSIAQTGQNGELSLENKAVCQDISSAKQCLLEYLKKDCEATAADIDLVGSMIQEFLGECTSTSSSNTFTLFNIIVLSSINVFVINI